MGWFRKPRWSVTWPTTPNGFYTQQVRATNPVDAVRAAAELDWPTAPGYTVAFDYEPQVWRLPYPNGWRSYPVAGPDFPGLLLGEITFTPGPLPYRQS